MCGVLLPFALECYRDALSFFEVCNYCIVKLEISTSEQVLFGAIL